MDSTQELYESLIALADKHSLDFSRAEWIELCDDLADAFISRANASRADDDREQEENEEEKADG